MRTSEQINELAAAEHWAANPLDADSTLENAYRTARREALADGRNLDAADGETAYKLGWIDGFNAAMSQARGLLDPALADFQKLLEGT